MISHYIGQVQVFLDLKTFMWTWFLLFFFAFYLLLFLVFFFCFFGEVCWRRFAPPLEMYIVLYLENDIFSWTYTWQSRLLIIEGKFVVAVRSFVRLFIHVPIDWWFVCIDCGNTLLNKFVFLIFFSFLNYKCNDNLASSTLCFKSINNIVFVTQVLFFSLFLVLFFSLSL